MSSIWNLFEKVPEKSAAKCVLCRKEYSFKTSVTNLKKHLNCKHFGAYESIVSSSNRTSESPVNEQLSDNEQEEAFGSSMESEIVQSDFDQTVLEETIQSTVKSQPLKRQSKVLGASIWEHFEKIPNKSVARCLLCENLYSYKTSITNLKKHLHTKHSTAYEFFLSSSEQMRDVSVAVKTESVPSDDEIEELESDVLESETNDSEPMETTHLIKLQPRRKLPKMLNKPHRFGQSKSSIDKKLLEMITQGYQPMSIVNDEGFKNFVQALNPYYELPHEKLISKTLIPSQYLECKNKIMKMVQNAKKVCITTDCWTSVNMDSYMAVNAHFISDFELKTVLLHCEHLSDTHTADALAVVLKNIASLWKIDDKISLAVSDNAQNLLSAIQKTGWNFFGCYLQKLNLVMEKAFEIIDIILEKVKQIVTYFKKNNLATEAILKHQTDMKPKSQAFKLIQSVPTRWNTAFYMLERFYKLKEALQSVIPTLVIELPVITNEIWEAIRQVCIILKPFEEITRVMSTTHYLPASLAIVIIDGLKNVITLMKDKPFFGIAKDFLIKLEEGLDLYFPEKEIEDSMLLGVCTFLDPRFKIHAFLDQNQAAEEVISEETSQRTKRAYLIKEQVLELIQAKLKENRAPSDPLAVAPTTTTVEDTESLSVWGKFNKTIAAITPSVDDTAKAANELELFLNEDVAERGSCPVTWWKTHACFYPTLAEIFYEHCHIVVTSVECERVFTKAGNYMTHKRSLLSRKRTAELVFLNSNKAYCR